MAVRTSLLAAVLTMLLAGCAGQGGGPGDGKPPVMTVLDYFEYCSALPGPDACLSDPICDRFKQELSQPPTALSACLAMCRKTGDDLYVTNLTNGCAGTLDRAIDLCDQFCRRRDRS